MPCTTVLVGKDASYNGSTMIARNEDAGGVGHFNPKKCIVLHPGDQPVRYRSGLSHLEIELPAESLRTTMMPNAVPDEGVWAAAGTNEANVSMTATETITSNSRVLGADPLVLYQPARTEKKRQEDGTVIETEVSPERAGGIGEEDMVSIVLPYIRSAREGVRRLGDLLTRYGTYEMNGIAFQDSDEIWWLETIGGHHWIARRVPDNACVLMPNQLGIDVFDLTDAMGAQEEFMCSADLPEFMERYHLDLTMRGDMDGDEEEEPDEGLFNPREAFGSHSDQDHVYNTPRAWYMMRYFAPHDGTYDGPDADCRPEDDDLPWCVVPERKITVEDVRYALSSHYQGTPYDPYATYGNPSERGRYRAIGINRTNFLSIHEQRPGLPADFAAVEWVAFASNVFNALVPFYPNVNETPAYLAETPSRVTTDSFYWASRLTAALADAAYGSCIQAVERYQMTVMAKSRNILNVCDAAQTAETDPDLREKLRERANGEIAAMLREETDSVLKKVLDEASARMKNAFSRADN